MSKYTTELRFICESITGNTSSQGYTKTDDIIEKARGKIFDFEYPIFDNEYKSVLETKILRHYYFREIGFETYGLWKFHLQNKMNEIMPYYNKMYNSEMIEFNPLFNIDVTRTKKNTNDSNKNTKQNDNSNSTFNSDITVQNNSEQANTKSESLTKTYDLTTNNAETGNTTDSGNTTQSGNNTETKLFQDTPQNDFTGSLDDKYLTNRTKTSTINSSNTSSENTVSNTNNSTNTQTGTVSDSNSITDNITNSSTNTTKQKDTTGRIGEKQIDVVSKTTDDYLEKITGKSNNNSYSSLIKEYRTTFINIDVMIIDELDELFFQLW